MDPSGTDGSESALMMRCDQGVTVWSPYLDPRPCFSDAGDGLDQACHGWRIVTARQ